MKAEHGPVRELLDGKRTFVVPIYQRNYSWEEAECRKLFDDIISIGRSVSNDTHFLGSVVYVADEGSVMGASRFLVIDGQQRLTTLSLLALAIYNNSGVLEETEFSADDLADLYLFNSTINNTSPNYIKLHLNKEDQSTYEKLINGVQLGTSDNNRIAANYNLFVGRLSSENIEPVMKGILRLVLVLIRLEAGKDHPQLIFESMNSTGKRLKQTDLIRNYVLMDLPEKKQNEFFAKYWAPMVNNFGIIPDAKLDNFMRNYLTLKLRRIPKNDAIYDDFKRWVRQNANAAGPLALETREELLQSLRSAADWYTRIAFECESHPALRLALDDLQSWNFDVTHPFLLGLYERYAAGGFGVEEFVRIIRLVESFIVRRSVAGIPTNALGKLFVTLLRTDDPNARLFDILQDRLSQLTSTRRFPTDSEIRKSLQSIELYGTKRIAEILRRIENSHHPKEAVVPGQYTIEHIMPQSLSKAWQSDLGREFARIHATCLHLLGNLTLTGYNSELSAKEFRVKRDMVPGGLSHSPLWLNNWVGAQERWSEDQIMWRGEMLTESFLGLWPAPPQLRYTDTVRTEAIPKDQATWHDYVARHSAEVMHLWGEVERVLTEKLPGTERSITKWYVNYIYDGAPILSVEPPNNATGGWLKLYFYVSVDQLVDPRGLVEDVTNVGHLSSGVSRVVLKVGDANLEYVAELLEQEVSNDIENLELV